jgi:DNA-binding HxlR family transcriptional regulator
VLGRFEELEQPFYALKGRSDIWLLFPTVAVPAKGIASARVCPFGVARSRFTGFPHTEHINTLETAKKVAWQMQELDFESEYKRTHKQLKSPFVSVDFAQCPVETSLGILGKKWTMAIIRDIGAYGVDRFSRLLESLHGIPSKVLATRLKQLEEEGFIQKYVEKSIPPKIVRWSLTEKGIDAIRVGMMLAVFGSKWYATRIFEDKRPRKMTEIYSRQGIELFMKDI